MFYNFAIIATQQNIYFNDVKYLLLQFKLIKLKHIISFH